MDTLITTLYAILHRKSYLLRVITLYDMKNPCSKAYSANVMSASHLQVSDWRQWKTRKEWSNWKRTPGSGWVCIEKSITISLAICYNTQLCSNRREWRKYYHHQEKSRSEPEKYLTIIIDGMHQNKTNVPHITQQTKSTQNLWRVRTHLTGALVHMKSEKGKLVFTFFDLLRWPHDSNLTITVLLNQLQSKFQELPRIL